MRQKGAGIGKWRWAEDFDQAQIGLILPVCNVLGHETKIFSISCPPLVAFWGLDFMCCSECHRYSDLEIWGSAHESAFLTKPSKSFGDTLE